MTSIEANVVTSLYHERRKITFNQMDGLIEDVGLPNGKADFVFNDDCVLFAGMGDVHIHAREDLSQKNIYKEDFLSAREAMHNGGVGHAGDMPNNPIPPVDDKSYEDKLRLSEKAGGSIWLYAGIGPETSPLSYPVPYKAYMGPSVGELFFKDLKSLDKALGRYRGEWVSFHCEDPEILEGHQDASDHYERRPQEAEVVATKDALALIEKYELTGKLCHYSTKEGLVLVRKARSRGVNVSLEATPQHLYFDQEKLHDPLFYQMNPPIRSQEDRMALFEALKNGEIQYLATDHAPHTWEEKKQGTSGLTGLDTFGPFVTWLMQEGITPHTIAKVACENPGLFFNQFLPSWKKISPIFERFGKGLGFVEAGYRANFTVLNLKRPMIVTKEHLRTKVGHSPFLNIRFPGSVEALFIGGQKV